MSLQWDSVDKSSVQEKKIKVVFLPAAGSEPSAVAATPVKQPHLTNGVSTPSDEVVFSLS